MVIFEDKICSFLHSCFLFNHYNKCVPLMFGKQTTKSRIHLSDRSNVTFFIFGKLFKTDSSSTVDVRSKLATLKNDTNLKSYTYLSNWWMTKFILCNVKTSASIFQSLEKKLGWPAMSKIKSKSAAICSSKALTYL